ncbi:inositol-pentakisphosphate 2-kinase [Thrips palmi]|uniref:Inositol-pentakisphosphate 2-kinase n=1 Tax=Thrips palmi TaxID=161013 RepID=A0A6P9A146_THRPL|nr:inositol-pentakisphosphate 2-kinase [Thrips palmi]
MDFSTPPEDLGAVKFVLASHEWQYRGEGNAKIAISLPAEKKVVLLPKSDKTDNINNSDFWHWISTNVKFINCIMKPIFGDMFVSSPSLVYLSSYDIQLLNETLASVRPEKRKDKELLLCGGELCSDHVYLPSSLSAFCKSKSFCIELKPKQGVFPLSERQFRNCLFCRKQQLKMKEGLVCQKSLYCPLDLFSGSWERMKNALVSLLCSPQNNLRIFHDGCLVYDEDHSDSDLQKVLMEWLPSVPKSNLVERISSILLQALTKDFSGIEGGKESPGGWVFEGAPPFDPEMESHVYSTRDALPHLPQPPCNYDSQELPEGCILRRLVEAQAVDNLGTALVHDLLKSHQQYSISMDYSLKSESINYVNNILSKGCSSELDPIERYLIAAVARDCSILITFQELKEDCKEAQNLPQVVDEDSRTHFLCHIAAVDLEPKPMSCINSQMKKKASILEACQQPVL